MMDLFLQNEREIAKRRQFSVISDYPETVTNILKSFVLVWGIPEVAIPTKKQRSQFSQWILELKELESLCGKNDTTYMMDKAYQNYRESGMNFMVTHPAAIQKLMIDTVSKINRENLKTIKEEVTRTMELESNKPLEDIREKLAGTAKELKSFLRKID